MNFKKTFVGFLGVLLVTGAFAAETASESPSAVTAQAPKKPWSVSASYLVARSLDTAPEAAEAEATLGAKWAFGPALQAGISVVGTNSIGNGPVNFLMGDTTLALTAPGFLKITALDLPVTGVAQLILPSSQASRDADLLAAGVLVVTASKEVLGVGSKTTLSSVLYGFEFDTIKVPVEVSPTGLAPAKIAKFTSALELTRSWLGLNWGVATSLANTLRYNTRASNELLVTPSVSYSILENLSIGLGVTNSLTFASGSASKSHLHVAPTASWQPVAGMSVDLEVACKVKADTLTWATWDSAVLSKLGTYASTLSVSYSF